MKRIVYMFDNLKQRAFSSIVDGALSGEHATAIAEVYFSSATVSSVRAIGEAKNTEALTISPASIEGWRRCVAPSRQMSNGTTRRCYGYVTGPTCRYCDQ